MSVRFRRTVSVNRAEDMSSEARRRRSRQPDKPIHRPSDSLLSSSSGYDNYRGLLNLCIVLLALSNGRVALENIIKYGILVDPMQWLRYIFHEALYWPFLLLIFCCNLFLLVAFVVELNLAKRRISESTGFRIHVLNLIATLVFPSVYVFLGDMHPVGSSQVLTLYSCLFMKLVSYKDVNRWCRQESNSNIRRRSLSLHNGDADTVTGIVESPLVVYPNNLTLKDLYYFLCVPTLCYELNFPHSGRIRKRFLFRRAVEMIFLIQLWLGLIQQWIVPIMQNSMVPFQQMDYSRMLERLLKLAVPNHLLWLMFFYMFFHSYLNFVAEVLRFADREFYRDWWNAESVHYFWQNWNIPVHRWCLRHMFLPMLKRGIPKTHASVAVFFVSAFFHEYLVSIPLKMFRLWAFMGMALQVPFAQFVEKYLSGKSANVAVWISLIIGQPLAILMYYHDWYIMNFRQI